MRLHVGKLLSRITLVGLVVLFSAGMAKGSMAQGSSTFPSQLGGITDAEKKETVAKIWQNHREYLQNGIWDKSQAELEKLYQWKLNQGIQNHYYYAVALIREINQLPKEVNDDVGSVILNYAERMAPDFSQVYYARAQWLWSCSPFSIGNATRAAGFWLRGIAFSLTNIEESLQNYSNFAYGVLFSFLIALAVFSISLALRYHSFFAHHFQHLFGMDLNPPAQAILGGLFLLLPFSLGIGWLGLFLIWLIVFWSYAPRSDRAVSLFLLIAMMLLPSAVRVSSALVYSRIGNGVPEILRANNGVWSPDLHQQLLNLHQRNPQDRDLLQAVSLVEKRMGKFYEAEQHLREWIKLEPKASAAFNNLGNVYLATNKVDQAVEAYQRAIQLEATRTESYYNLGQAYLLNLLLNEAESEFRRAKELRPQLISFYTSIASRNPNRMAIDRTLDSVHLWRRIVEVTPEMEALSEGFWSFLGAFYALPAEEVLGGAFLVLLGWVHWGRRGIPLIRRCERCGRLICSRCSRSRVIGSQCVQCLNAFSKSPSGDPGLMKTKRIEVARYQLRKLALSRWLSFIFPGTGHLHRGHPKEGFLYIFIGAYFLMKVLCWHGWVPNSMDLGISSSLPWVAAILFLFLIYYGWVQFRMTQILRREAKFYFRPAE